MYGWRLTAACAQNVEWRNPSDSRLVGAFDKTKSSETGIKAIGCARALGTREGKAGLFVAGGGQDGAVSQR